jgi:hypothetical protein
MFATVIRFHLSLICGQGYEPTTQAGTREEPLMRLPPNDRAPSLAQKY